MSCLHAMQIMYLRGILGTVGTYIVVVIILTKLGISVLVVDILHVSCTHHLSSTN